MINEQSTRLYRLEDLIKLVQKGNKQLQNDLLTSYQPFIAKAVSEVCKRYIDPKNDDEFSVGMIAFNEAIFKYVPERGSSFLSFANLVVKRKVIDYIRQIKKTPDTMSFNEPFGEEQMENPLEVAAVREQCRKNKNALLLREELHDYNVKLKAFKLNVPGLLKAAPKHKDARESAIQNAKILYKDPVLHAYVCKKKRLPIQALSKKVAVSKKTLERNRKFILAVFIVLNENYLYLKEYLKGVGVKSGKTSSPKYYKLATI